MSDRHLLGTVTPPLDGRAFRWSVGTRPVPASQWLHIDDARYKLMLAKDAVLASDAADSVITTAAGIPASSELLDVVTTHLSQWHTGDYNVTAESIVDLHSQRTTVLDSGSPLETLAQALPEDFCILTRDGDSWRLTAACVCFTSRWNLADKIGANVREIHEPVPGYADRIGDAVEHLMNRMDSEQVLRRSNWTLLSTPELHLPEPATPMTAVDDIWDLGWLRIERQSLRKLPMTGAMIFTIDTRVHRVDELEPDERRKLHGAVRAAPRNVAYYKGWPTDG